MNLKKLERSEIKDMKYYTITIFQSNGKNGVMHPIAYSRIGNARNAIKRLVNVNNCHALILREEDIFVRNENTEISSSTPIEKYVRTGNIKANLRAYSKVVFHKR